MSDFRAKALEHGLAALRAGDFQTAGHIAETAVAREPNDLQALALLGSIHNELGNYGTALAISRMALQVAHAAGQVKAEHWYNVSGACRKTYQMIPALDALDKAAALALPTDPDIAIAYSSYWLTYGDPVKAEAYARQALILDPRSAMARSNLGMALLGLDRWAEAWPHFEARKQLKRWSWPIYPFPDWSGEYVKTLIIGGEQGLGDELMCGSLIRRLEDRADRVVVVCSERLVPLLRRSLGCEVYGSMKECAANGVFDPALLDEIGKPKQATSTVSLDIAPPRDDRPSLAAIASLPMFLDATRENTANSAYLQVDPVRAIDWRARLSAVANGRPIVAVAWKGGTFENHEVLRNPPREMFMRLSPEKYLLVSVQYTEGAAAQAAQMGMLHFQQAIDDIDEQAALVKACDKLVTVAQTAMHIGGGVGTDTLALIGRYPKWDCGQTGDSVPWWSSVKAIRQVGDDWTGVFDRLLIALGETPATVTDKAMRFGAMPSASVDLSHLAQINITGESDAAQTDLRDAVAAE